MDVLCAENLHSRVWFDKWPYDACAHACDCMATDIPPSHSSLLRARAILFFFWWVDACFLLRGYALLSTLILREDTRVTGDGL